jgi:hypothetical protein
VESASEYVPSMTPSVQIGEAQRLQIAITPASVTFKGCSTPGSLLPLPRAGPSTLKTSLDECCSLTVSIRARHLHSQPHNTPYCSLWLPLLLRRCEDAVCLCPRYVTHLRASKRPQGYLPLLSSLSTRVPIWSLQPPMPEHAVQSSCMPFMQRGSERLQSELCILAQAPTCILQLQCWRAASIGEAFYNITSLGSRIAAEVLLHLRSC